MAQMTHLADPLLGEPRSEHRTTVQVRPTLTTRAAPTGAGLAGGSGRRCAGAFGSRSSPLARRRRRDARPIVRRPARPHKMARAAVPCDAAGTRPYPPARYVSSNASAPRRRDNRGIAFPDAVLSQYCDLDDIRRLSERVGARNEVSRQNSRMAAQPCWSPTSLSSRCALAVASRF